MCVCVCKLLHINFFMHIRTSGHIFTKPPDIYPTPLDQDAILDQFFLTEWN